MLQQLIDSQPGIVIASALHTLGAIGLLGGLIGYLAWHRGLRRGHHNPNVLVFATFLTYLSIVVNLLGGFMRTYQTGHPGITDFGSSSWVRAIAIKHVFLFLGMGAAVYLLERVATDHLAAFRDGALAKAATTGHTLGVLALTLAIVVAAVLGAVSTVLPTGAAEAPMEEPAMQADVYLNASGTYQATPLSPGQAGGELNVPDGVHDIEVTLTWTSTASNLGVQLLDPAGAVAKQFAEADGSLTGTLGAVPTPGTWTYRITSSDPVVSTGYTLQFHLPAGNGTAHGHL